MTNTGTRQPLCAGLAAALALAGGGAAADTLDSAIRIESQIQVAAAESQDRVDVLAEQTEQLLDEYRAVNREIESLRIYNGKLEELLAAQRAEVESLNEQLDRVTLIERQIMPLILGMIDTLEQFIELDVPFQLEERRARVANLRELVDRADVSVAEKYRKVMEAYQIENEYGRNSLAYEGPLATNGETRKVTFLRVGRVALLYETLDRSEVGMWDVKAGAWQELSDDYRRAVHDGIRIAKDLQAPELLRLPIPAPENGR